MMGSLLRREPLLLVYFVITALGCLPVAASATPKDHQQKFQNYFLDKAPAIPFNSYANDYHHLDGNIAQSGLPFFNQQALEGEKLLSRNFSNGHGYSYCFRNNGVGIGSDYPYFDVLDNQVKTLATAINGCREENGEHAYPYESSEIKNLQLYMMESSRKNITNVIMQNGGAAEAAFNKGKTLFFARRGQLDMACAHCHIDHSNQRYGTLQIPPALGLPLRMPRYNRASNKIVTLHERFNECLSYTKAKPFPLQSEELRNLEFYLYYINNNLPLNAPSVK